MPAVVRLLEQPFRERLGREHLASRRHDQPFQLAEEPTRIAVRRHDDGVGLELGDIANATALDDLGARVDGARSEATNEPGGL